MTMTTTARPCFTRNTTFGYRMLRIIGPSGFDLAVQMLADGATLAEVERRLGVGRMFLRQFLALLDAVAPRGGARTRGIESRRHIAAVWSARRETILAGMTIKPKRHGEKPKKVAA